MILGDHKFVGHGHHVDDCSPTALSLKFREAGYGPLTTFVPKCPDPVTAIYNSVVFLGSSLVTEHLAPQLTYQGRCIAGSSPSGRPRLSVELFTKGRSRICPPRPPRRFRLLQLVLRPNSARISFGCRYRLCFVPFTGGNRYD